MGRKINPVGIRLKVNRDWESRWYAEGDRYVELLHEDRRIRTYVKKETERAGVAKIEIERQPGLVSITIHTVRPGLIIGRKGETVKELRTNLENMTGKTVRVEVSEVEKPDTNPQLIAENIAGQLERRVGHSRAMKRALTQAMRQGAQGIRMEVSGRLGGADMSRREWMSEGRVPRNTLRAAIGYGFAEAHTTYGRIGIKVWVYTGDVLQTELAEPEDDQEYNS